MEALRPRANSPGGAGYRRHCRNEAFSAAASGDASAAENNFPRSGSPARVPIDCRRFRAEAPPAWEPRLRGRARSSPCIAFNSSWRSSAPRFKDSLREGSGHVLLKLENLTKSFGTVEVLRNVSFEIEKGDLLVLLGESGCGKSTLLNCIAGLEEISSGRIEINGRDVTGIEPSDRDIAMVFQSYALYPTMNVARNIGFSLECQGVGRAERRDAVERVAKILQISELLNRKPSQLSGGQKQRVAIGRALVRDPVIFLLDEPMSNLDAKLRHQMRQELRDLHGILGATFILVTHDQIEAMSMATKVAVMDGGRIRQFGTPYDIYHAPGDKFVAEFVGLSKMNFLEGRLAFSGSEACVEVGGRRAPLGHYAFAGDKPADGTRVLLGVRPENIYRSKERLEGSSHFEAELEVLKRELTGGDVQVWFEFGGKVVSCRIRSSRMPEIGARTTLFFDLQNASLFHAETGKRI